jgi:choline-glycine betaine transporter
MFFGVLEPITHTLNSPMGIDPADTDTACAICMSAAIMHWGLHAWAIYAVVGLSLAFFCFNRGMQLTLRLNLNTDIHDRARLERVSRRPATRVKCGPLPRNIAYPQDLC